MKSWKLGVLASVILLAATLPRCKYVLPNQPPTTPGTPTGPSSMQTGVPSEFTVETTDPDGDSIRYVLDWNDGRRDTSNYMTSGTSWTISHSWSTADTYSVRAMAQDAHEASSGWSGGHSTVVGPAEGSLRWCYGAAGGWITSICPAIGSDGTVYVGTDSGYLCAVNPDGTLKRRWRPNAWVTGSPISTPAISPDGTVWFKAVFCFAPGSVHLCLYAIGSDGHLGMRSEIRDWTGSRGYVSCPAFGADGTVYLSTGGDSLYAIRPDGTFRWCYRTDGYIHSSPAVGPDGTVYVGSNDGYLYAINPDGTLKWRYETEYCDQSSPAIGSDGTVYLGADCVYAIGPDGVLRWRYETQDVVESSPVVGSDGTVYVGSDDGHLYAISSSGALRWWCQMPSSVESSPALGSSDLVYVGSSDTLFAINPDGTVKWRFPMSCYASTSAPAISSDGTVYVGNGRCIYAIAGMSPLAVCAWPKFHRDLCNTGRVGGP